MPSPLSYKVRARTRGESKTRYLANFRERTDAVNFAHDCSRGRYFGQNVTVTAYDVDGKVFMKYCEGDRVK